MAVTVSKDINLGTLVPIILFLLIQTGTGIWWASAVQTDVLQLRVSVLANTSRIDSERMDSDAENLRQWDRISGVEAATRQASATAEVIATKVDNITTSITELRGELRDSNKLILELLRVPARAVPYGTTQRPTE
jgi:hypothetical protein